MNALGGLELLAPGGDKESLVAAVRFGADAVYVGGKEFSMRVSPANFTLEELYKAVDYAHSRNVKVYLTCNTLPRNDEIERIPEFLARAAECGVDAFIISDLGVLALAKKYAPDVDVHISTQMGVVNFMTARQLHEMGAKRVVLARELSVSDIGEIRAKTSRDLELEVFVHGAMCVSFSGRCLISSYLTGRDANRGDCAQPCRWNYALVEEKRPEEYFSVVENEEGTYFFNSKDLCMIEHLDDLLKAGVSSFKIEGRAKSSYYVSVVTNAYRLAIDKLLADPENYLSEDWVVQEVNKVSHRDYCTGFYYGYPSQIYERGSYISDSLVVAVVEGYENGELIISQRNRFFEGDAAEVLEPRKRPYSIRLENLKDIEGNAVSVANRAAAVIKMPYPNPIEKGSIIRMDKK